MKDQQQVDESGPSEDADDASSGMSRGLVVLVVLAVGLIGVAFATGHGDALRQAVKLIFSALL